MKTKLLEKLSETNRRLSGIADYVSREYDNAVARDIDHVNSGLDKIIKELTASDIFENLKK